MFVSVKDDVGLFARFPAAPFPLTALGFSTVGRLGLSWWWLMPCAMGDLLIRLFTSEVWCVERSQPGEAMIVQRTRWRSRVVATFPLRAWMSVDRRNDSLAVGTDDAAWLLICSSTEDEMRRAASRIESFLSECPATELVNHVQMARVDVHRPVEFLVRGCSWLLVAWIARRWHSFVFVASLATAVQVLISAAWFIRQRSAVNPIRKRAN
jgi:hypothetical protein